MSPLSNEIKELEHIQPKQNYSTNSENDEQTMIPNTEDLNESRLLALLDKALDIEKERSLDQEIYGSTIMNLLQAIVSGTIDFESVGFKIFSSYVRRLSVKSNRMRYTKDEIEFWNFVRLLRGESVIRTLRGLSNYGATKRGSQAPEECQINLAIPSLKIRKNHDSASRSFSVSPGFEDSSFQALNDAGVEYVNLSCDEKSLSPGIQLYEHVDHDTQMVSFTVDGDADWYFKEINEHKDNLISNITTYAKEGIQNNNCIIYFCDIESRLSKLLTTTENKMKKLRTNNRMNKISISRETANAANIESALREVKVVKENIFKVKLLQDSGIDPSLAITEDSVLTIEVPNLLLNHDHANLPKSHTSRHLHSLCGLSSIDIMKSTWKQKKTFESSLDTDLEYSAMPVFAQFMKFIDPHLNLSQYAREVNVKGVKLHLTGSLLISIKGESFVNIMCKEINNANIIDVMTQMEMFTKTGLISIVNGETIEVFKIPYTKDVKSIVTNILQIISDGRCTKPPSQLSECSKNLRKMFVEFKKSHFPQLLFKIPLCMKNVTVRKVQDSWNKCEDKICIDIQGCDNIFKDGIEVSCNKITALLPSRKH